MLTTSPVTTARPSSGAAAADERLAGVDADPHRQAQRGSAAFSSAIASRIRSAGPDRPFGVVLVRDRGAEDGHRRRRR